MKINEELVNIINYDLDPNTKEDNVNHNSCKGVDGREDME